MVDGNSADVWEVEDVRIRIVLAGASAVDTDVPGNGIVGALCGGMYNACSSSGRSSSITNVLTSFWASLTRGEEGSLKVEQFFSISLKSFLNSADER
jgi:hypothetical protein